LWAEPVFGMPWRVGSLRQVAAAEQQEAAGSGQRAQDDRVDQGIYLEQRAAEVIENHVGCRADHYQLGVEEHQGGGAEYL